MDQIKKLANVNSWKDEWSRREERFDPEVLS